MRQVIAIVGVVVGIGLGIGACGSEPSSTDDARGEQEREVDSRTERGAEMDEAQSEDRTFFPRNEPTWVGSSRYVVVNIFERDGAGHVSGSFRSTDAAAEFEPVLIAQGDTFDIEGTRYYVQSLESDGAMLVVQSG